MRFRPEVEQLETRAVPSVTLGYPGNQTSYDGDPINAIFLAQDSAGYPVSLSATGLPAGLSVATLDSSTGSIYGNIASNADASGPYTVTITGTAADGSASQSFTWYVLQPTVTFYNPGDQSNFDNDTVYLGPAAYENAGHTLTYSAANLPTGLSINSTSGLISGTLTNASLNGPYTVTLTATDSAANVSGSTTFNWAVNAIVTMTYPGNQENQGLDAVNIPLSATISNGDTPTFTAIGLPSGLSISGGAITGTITENDGQDYTNNVSITATDPVTGASDTAYFSYQVDSNVYYNVNTLTDTGSGKFNVGDLRYCISSIDYSQATASNFYVNSTIVGTISLNGSALPALVGKNFTINGSGLTVDAGYASGIFAVNSDATAEIDNITLANAANAPAVVNAGNLTMTGGGIDNCTNGAVYDVGFFDPVNQIYNYDTNFTNGGAIYEDGVGTVTGCTFNGTWANGGGGGAIYVVARANERVTNSTFSGCEATGGSGGAILSDGTLNLRGCTFYGNSATAARANRFSGYGGAISSNSSSAQIDSCTFSSNQSDISGGAIDFENGATGPITNSQFYWNTSGAGGALFATGSGTNITVGVGCEIMCNTASGNGGGINIGDGATATIQGDAQIYSNTAELMGGGISNGGTLVVNSATIYQNLASSGGGLANYGTATLTSASVTDNSTTNPGQGGGFYAVQGSTTTVVSGCTISGNSSPNRNGAFVAAGAMFTANQNANNWGNNQDIGQ